MSIRKLSFKEYVDTKTKLRESIKQTPRQTTEYSVHRYCKLVVGETKESKNYISLKPGQRIFVDWEYLSFENPTPQNIRFKGVRTLIESTNYQTYWEGRKLLQWLNRNTFEKDLF